jgi:hypothetical protein
LQDKANPLAQILSAAMLLRYALNEATAANRIEAAVLAALDAGYRTGDIMSAGMVSPFLAFFLLSIVFPHVLGPESEIPGFARLVVWIGVLIDSHALGDVLRGLAEERSLKRGLVSRSIRRCRHDGQAQLLS